MRGRVVDSYTGGQRRKTPKVTVFMTILESSVRVRVASYLVYSPEDRRELAIKLEGFTCKRVGLHFHLGRLLDVLSLHFPIFTRRLMRAL